VSLSQALIFHASLVTWQTFFSLHTLQNTLNSFGYLAVILFIMIESTGIPFPGETMLLFASFYTSIDSRLNIFLVIASAAVGAILGDNFGYLIGRTGGRAVVEKYGKYVLIQQKHLDSAERFFQKHGDKTVFLGRFTAILRAWAAFLAGVNKMRWKVFLMYNAAGGIVWAILYGTLGYIAGKFFSRHFALVERIASTLGWLGVILFLLGILLPVLIIQARRKKSEGHKTSGGTQSLLHADLEEDISLD
jgi:membrane protein DedA with SNARE-associated domain